MMADANECLCLSLFLICLHCTLSGVTRHSQHPASLFPHYSWGQCRQWTNKLPGRSGQDKILILMVNNHYVQIKSDYIRLNRFICLSLGCNITSIWNFWTTGRICPMFVPWTDDTALIFRWPDSNGFAISRLVSLMDKCPLWNIRPGLSFTTLPVVVQ